MNPVYTVTNVNNCISVSDFHPRMATKDAKINKPGLYFLALKHYKILKPKAT